MTRINKIERLQLSVAAYWALDRRRGSKRKMINISLMGAWSNVVLVEWNQSRIRWRQWLRRIRMGSCMQPRMESPNRRRTFQSMGITECHMHGCLISFSSCTYVRQRLYWNGGGTEDVLQWRREGNHGCLLMLRAKSAISQKQAPNRQFETIDHNLLRDYTLYHSKLHCDMVIIEDLMIIMKWKDENSKLRENIQVALTPSLRQPARFGRSTSMLAQDSKVSIAFQLSTQLSTMGIVIILSLSIIVILGISYLTKLRQRHGLSHANGCRPATKYPHWDPVLGLDLFFMTGKLFEENRYLPNLVERYAKLGRTFETNLLGSPSINTIEPRNLQTVYVAKSKDWGVQPVRLPAQEPFCGRGFITTDGTQWEHSRALLKPSFNRANIDLVALERGLRLVLGRIPKDGSSVDLQPLFLQLVRQSALSQLGSIYH